MDKGVDFILIALASFLSDTWNFLIHVTVPGLGGISFGGMYLAILVISISFIVIRKIRSVNSE